MHTVKHQCGDVHMVVSDKSCSVIPQTLCGWFLKGMKYWGRNKIMETAWLNHHHYNNVQSQSSISLIKNERYDDTGGREAPVQSHWKKLSSLTSDKFCKQDPCQRQYHYKT